jgi:acetylornithine deacetylase/succinyl-diaminopimelate desuccinylase-like protein
MLACDLCLNPDAGMIAPDKPTVTTGLRGLAYFELRVYGPGKDLHSGLFGGTIHNPAQALVELIAGMHDKNGRVTCRCQACRSAHARGRPLSLPI